MAGQFAGPPGERHEISETIPRRWQQPSWRRKALRCSAYGHCKTIAHCPGTKVILDKAGVEPDEGVVPHDLLLTVGPGPPLGA